MHTDTLAFSMSVNRTIDHVTHALRRVERFEFMTQKLLEDFLPEERHPLASMRTLMNRASRRTCQQRALIALSLSKDPMAPHVLRCVERAQPRDAEVVSFMKLAMGRRRMLSERRQHEALEASHHACRAA